MDIVVETFFWHLDLRTTIPDYGGYHNPRVMACIFRVISLMTSIRYRRARSKPRLTHTLMSEFTSYIILPSFGEILMRGRLRRNLLINIHAESVLLGHENWVTGVHWHNQQGKIPRLLTASADRSMMMWGLDPATKIWLNTNRFGEIGGTNLGFFGALWGAQGKTIYAHGWGGSFHVWKNVQEQDQDQESWKSRLSISGHYGHVTSLAWEPEGKYIVSVSTDQTARLHASWRRDNGTETWHEMARPQIHGYDMEDVAFLSRMRYISGSEEKIVRVFDAPGVFIESMHQLGVDENLIDDVSLNTPSIVLLKLTLELIG